MFDFTRVSDIVLNHEHITYLNKIGIEIEPIFENIRLNIEKNGDILDNIFSNQNYQMLSSNIFLEKIIFREINQYLYKNYKESVIFEEYIKIDLKTIIATQNSIIERPKLLNPSEIEEGFKIGQTYMDNFIQIARFENEMIEKKNGWGREGQVIIFEGIIPFRVHIHPFSEKEPSCMIWKNKFYDYEPRNIIGFCKKNNSIESNNVLWLNSYILDILKLKLDGFNNGLQALNEANEVVLKFRQWRSNLIGNGSSFVGQDSNIAKLEGCDLILREDYYERLKMIIPDMEFYSKKLELS